MDARRDAVKRDFPAEPKRIGKRGPASDICFPARQLPIPGKLAQVCDEPALALGHCGVPDMAGGNFDDWARGIWRLAGLPQVNVKLSGGQRPEAEALGRPCHRAVRRGSGGLGIGLPVVLPWAGLKDWSGMAMDLLAPCP